jgi:hypothetical protein
VGEPGMPEAAAGGHAGKLKFILQATTTFIIDIILLTTVIFFTDLGEKSKDKTDKGLHKEHVKGTETNIKRFPF